MSKKRIYLVIESKKREMDSRIFFCILAAFNGYSAVLSTKTKLYSVLKNLKNGIFISKSIGPKNFKDFSQIINFGNSLCSWDEEGINFYNAEQLTDKKSRMDPKCLDLIEYFFLWGENHFNAVNQKFSKYSNKLVITGNPRIEILKKLSGFYNFKSEEIKKKHGNFILITTKFSRTNRKSKSDWVEDFTKAGFIQNEKEKEFQERTVNLEKKNLEIYLNTINNLSKKISSKIIIRPHPAEDPILYLKFFENNSKVKVINDNDNTNSWIAASNILISFNCVTSIEAYMLNKYSINYIPFRDEEYEFEIPKICSHNIYEEKDLINFVLKNENTNLNSKKNDRPKLSHYIKNLTDNTSSIENILEYINNIAIKGNKKEDINSNWYFNNILKIKYKTYALMAYIKSIYSKEFRKSYISLKKKREGFSRENVLANFHLQKKYIDNVEDVKMSEIFPGVYCFEKK